MKTKISAIFGLLAVVLLLGSFLPVATPKEASAAPAANVWERVGLPLGGAAGKFVINPGSDVTDIAVGKSGKVIYACDELNGNHLLYKSVDGGRSWSCLTTSLAQYLVTPAPVKDIAIAPDDEKVVVIVVAAAPAEEVWMTTDGGASWLDLTGLAPWGAVPISDISVSSEISAALLRRNIVITTDGGVGTTAGSVYRIGTTGVWQDLVAAASPTLGAPDPGVVRYLACEVSPRYPADWSIAVLAVSDGVTDVFALLPGAQTYGVMLCLIETEPTVRWNWDIYAGLYPVRVTPGDGAALGSADSFDVLTGCLTLPGDWDPKSPYGLVTWLGFDTGNVPGLVDEDVYRVDFHTPYALGLPAMRARGIASIDISPGPVLAERKGRLMVGMANFWEVLGVVPILATVQFTTEPFARLPKWDFGFNPPRGMSNVQVAFDPTDKTGMTAYAGTTGTGIGDESCFAVTFLGGLAWEGWGLVDTILDSWVDMTPAPDGSMVFIAQWNTTNPILVSNINVWRSKSDPIGRHWERVWMEPVAAVLPGIVRMSPDFEESKAVVFGVYGGTRIRYTPNAGATWAARSAPGAIGDIVVVDKDKFYVANLGTNLIFRTIDAGWSWVSPPGDSLIAALNMFSVAPDGTILAAGTANEVAFSTDGGASFKLLPIIPTALGNVQVVADRDIKDNGIIYAASNVADAGVWRTDIRDVSPTWEQIDPAITALATGQIVSGLAVGNLTSPEFKGVLYVGRAEAVAATAGGMTRSLDPQDEMTPWAPFFEMANMNLPAGVTFDPSLIFATMVPSLKIAETEKENRLWAIDTTTGTLWSFRDTLAKANPELVSPADKITLDTPDRVFLTWALGKVKDAQQWDVQVWRGAALFGTWNPAGFNLSQTVTGLERGTDYTWRVRVSGGVGAAALTDGLIRSQWASRWAFTTRLGPEFPADEGYLTKPPICATVTLPAVPTFSWRKVEWADGYKVIVAKDADFKNVVATSPEVKSTSWKGPSLAVGEYWWKVQVLKGGKVNIETETSNFTVVEPVVPVPPPTPAWVWVVIALGAIFIIATLILIARMRPTS